MLKTFVLFAIAGLFWASCTHYHYSPNLLHTPYLTQKNDGVATAAIGGSPTTLNIDVHAAYSPIKHGSVFVNFFHNRSSFERSIFLSNTNYQQKVRGHLIEAGIGAYRPLFFGTGAIYAGIGSGAMHNDYDLRRFADLRLNRIFVQPTFTFKNNWFRLGMGLKLVRLSYTKGNVDFRIEPSDIDVIERLEEKSPLWFPEIGGNLGFHFKPVTLYAGMVLVLSSQVFDYGLDGANVGVGITYEFQAKLAKKPRKNGS
ncbi:MAG: hypothetical protein SFV22_16850 [Saprospiraceae bacterium]|nr:hypothetical protein [Saprospiraceae bacterium]